MTATPPAARTGSWRWRRRVALALIGYCGLAVLVCLTPLVTDAKASALITPAFSLAGAVFWGYVAGAVTHDISKPKETP